jgi:GH25 family lysozyme M1 (1,4-beta-N-acetylmuramidase)
VAAVTVSALALLAGPAATATATAAVSHPARPAATGAFRHDNTGATHSPELLRQLATPPAAAVPRQAGPGPAIVAQQAPYGLISGAVQGVDVASYQESGGIDWAQVAASGIKFAVVKATEGDYYANSYASADLTAAQAAGIAVLAYAFAIPNGGGFSASPVTQANYLIAHAADAGGDVPPLALDIEYDPYTGDDHTNECYGLTPAAMTSWISAFSARVQAVTGQPPVIYTTQDWWATCTGASTALASDPLWVAAYPDAASSSPGPLPAGWTTWNDWQYTSTGTVTGIPDTGHVDLDQLNPAALTLLSPGTQRTLTGTAVSLQLAASVSGASYAATGLPAGLSIDPATGQVAGTPATPGAYPVTVTATAPAPAASTASASFTWDVHGTISATAPPTRTSVAGSPASFRLRAADSVSGQQLSFTATGLPPGVSVAPDGQVTGWPLSPHSYRVKVTATDAIGATASATFTWTVRLATARGAGGAVGSALSSRDCLAADGSVTVLRGCADTAAQRWDYLRDGTLRSGGRCLTVPGSHPVSGSRPRLETCTGAARQQWQPAYPGALSASAGSRATTLVSPWAGRCLTMPGKTAGTAAVIRACAGTAGQSWTLPAGPVLSGVPGKCLDDYGNRTASGTKADIWTCDGASRQAWTLSHDGTIRVHGRCLGVSQGKTASGSPVGLYKCDGTGAEIWRVVPAAKAGASPGPGFLLQNARSGRCLTDPDSATTSGTRLVIESCSAAPGSTWRAA